jgi:hypothetical protein
MIPQRKQSPTCDPSNQYSVATAATTRTTISSSLVLRSLQQQIIKSKVRQTCVAVNPNGCLPAILQGWISAGILSRCLAFFGVLITHIQSNYRSW